MSFLVGIVILLFACVFITLFPVLFLLLVLFAIVFLVFKIYESIYYRSEKFVNLKDRISSYTKDCNDLNSHIEDLKKVHIGFDQTTYGTASTKDVSRWNYKRPKLAEKSSAQNVHSCSRSVCSSAADQPIKYVCKYFNIKADEAHLEQFEETLNNFEAVEAGKTGLKNEEKKIIDSVAHEIPFLIRKFSRKLPQKLGFNKVDLSESYFPVYKFQYVSSGGNASMDTTVVMNIENLNAMVNYLNDRIKWKKSAAGQRALMTSSLRKKILARDGFKCRSCGANIKDEPNLLLEVDHIIPVSKGGMTTEDNLQTLCWRCNRSKGAKIINDLNGTGKPRS